LKINETSGNKIGREGLECMWTALQYQVTRQRLLETSPAAPGLLKLSIQVKATHIL